MSELAPISLLLQARASVRGESHIDFRTQCIIMALAGWGWGVVTNDVLKIQKSYQI